MAKAPNLELLSIILVPWASSEGSASPIEGGIKIILSKLSYLILSYAFFLLFPIVSLISGFLLSVPFANLPSNIWLTAFLTPSVILFLLVIPLVLGIYIAIAKLSYDKKPVSLNEALNITKGRYITLFFINLIALVVSLTITIVLVSALQIIGLLLSLIIVLFLLCILLGSSILAIVENYGVLESITTTLQIGFTYYGVLFGMAIILNAIFSIIGVMIYALLTIVIQNLSLLWALVAYSVFLPFQVALIILASTSFYYQFVVNENGGDQAKSDETQTTDKPQITDPDDDFKY